MFFFFFRFVENLARDARARAAYDEHHDELGREREIIACIETMPDGQERERTNLIFLNII